MDGLINCAGSLACGPVAGMSNEEIDEMIDVNLRGLIYCCKYAVIPSGGHIVNIASSSFSRGRADHAVYSSTKAAVVNFTQGFSQERLDLLVNAVIPQRTATPLRERNFGKEPSAGLLSPEEVAETTISLLRTPDLTGQMVEVRLHGEKIPLSCQ